MKSARSGSAAFGIVAGAAVVSSSIMGGLLGGSMAAEASTVSAADVSTVLAAAPNVCGQPPAATSAARSVPAGQTALVLDAALTSASKAPKTSQPKATTSSSSSPSPSASTKATATAKATATPSAKATATPTATAKATPSATATATPKATASASATPSSKSSATPTPTPTTSTSASATPTPTTSKSASPSPSPSPTGSSPSVQLCLEVQAITTKSGVHPGGTASYAIWVWPAGGAASSVTVTISSKAASKDVTPKFSVCPTASGSTCKVGGIAKGRSDELQATAAVPGSTAAGKDISLSATAKASDATAPPAADAAIKITAKPSSAHSSPSPTPTDTSSGSGLGATLPPGVLPAVPLTTTQGATLPELPGPTTSAGSPGGLFPTVSPQPSPSPYSAVLPSARGVRVTDAAATFPFSTRLIGGELVGLVVLAAALAIGIVRFSLRRPRPQGKDAAS